MKIALVSHLDHSSQGGAAARINGIEKGLAEVGHSINRFVLRPDTRLRARVRGRSLGPWWYLLPSPAWLAEFVDEAEKSDVVIASYLGATAPLVAPLQAAGVSFIYDGHNDEQRLAELVRTARTAARIRAMERRVMFAAKTVWVAGARDAATLRERYPSVPIADVPNAAPTVPLMDGSWRMNEAFTYGTWGYQPNAEGLLRFARTTTGRSGIVHVFGSLRGRLWRRVQMHARTMQPLVAWNRRGFARSLDDLISNARGPCVLPVWSGGGTKVRTLEMAAAGVPLVVTPEAVAGLPAWLAQALRPVGHPDELLERAFTVSAEERRAAHDLAQLVRDRLTWARILEPLLST